MAGEVGILRKDNPVAQLEEKFKGWVIQQPEWLLIVNMPRQQRRAAMKELASRLYTIPVMDGANTVPRVIRRKVAKQLSAAARSGEMNDQLKAAMARAALQEAMEADLAQKAAEAFPEPATALLVDEPTPEGGKGVSLADAESEFQADMEDMPEYEPHDHPQNEDAPPFDPEGDVKAQLGLDEERPEAEESEVFTAEELSLE